MNRRLLRAQAAAWLFVQLLSLMAFAPLDCCRLHDHGGAPAQVTAPEPDCHHGAPPVQDKCRMRSACDSPAAALLSVLSNHGILPVPVALLLQPAPAPGATSSDARPIRLSVPPDSPPPRA